MPRRLRSIWIEELAGSDFEIVGKFLDDENGWVSGTSFEVTDIGAMNADLVGKGLLGKPPVLPQLA